MFQVWKSRNFPCLLHNLCTVSLSVKTRMRQHGRLTPHATSCNFWDFHQIGKRVQSLAVNLRTLVLKAAGQVSSHTYDGSNEYCKYWTWNIQTRSTILQELRTVDSVRWNLIFSPPPPNQQFASLRPALVWSIHVIHCLPDPLHPLPAPCCFLCWNRIWRNSCCPTWRQPLSARPGVYFLRGVLESQHLGVSQSFGQALFGVTVSSSML